MKGIHADVYSALHISEYFILEWNQGLYRLGTG